MFVYIEGSERGRAMGQPDRDEHVEGAAGPVPVGALRKRVSILEPGIVLLREAPNGTYETYSVLLERAKELGRGFDDYALVVDLSEATERPRGRYLELIRRSSDEPVHVALTQPGGGLLRAALRFVIGGFSRRGSTHAADSTARRIVSAI